MPKMVAVDEVAAALENMRQYLNDVGLSRDAIDNCLSVMDKALQAAEVAYTPSAIAKGMNTYIKTLRGRYLHIIAQEGDADVRARLERYLVDGVIRGMEMLAEDMVFWLR